MRAVDSRSGHEQRSLPRQRHKVPTHQVSSTDEERDIRKYVRDRGRLTALARVVLEGAGPGRDPKPMGTAQRI